MSALESIINKGGKVVETDLIKLTEFLMNQLLKLDGIVADGDIKLQRKMQVLLKTFFFLIFQKHNSPLLDLDSLSQLMSTNCV